LVCSILVTEVTQILQAIDSGDPQAAERLLPLVYDELRKLAASKLRHEQPQTLQATALVHEAYLRLVGNDAARPWDSRGHFFAAAAQAMRRILIESARRRATQKRAGDREREDLDAGNIFAPEISDDVLELDEALQKLKQLEPQAAEIVNLRYFAGLTLPEIAQLFGISTRSVDRQWAYARAWLHQELRDS
jgi:RNA polymerase sigma factor (TIGR02999 family)